MTIRCIFYTLDQLNYKTRHEIPNNKSDNPVVKIVNVVHRIGLIAEPQSTWATEESCIFSGHPMKLLHKSPPASPPIRPSPRSTISANIPAPSQSSGRAEDIKSSVLRNTSLACDGEMRGGEAGGREVRLTRRINEAARIGRKREKE